MRIFKSFILLFMMTVHLLADPATWGKLPSLPDAHGFAGAFAGVVGKTLLVAGGANFPNAPLAAGGEKVWHDTVYALAQPDGEWRVVGKLPGPRGYGVSVDTGDGVLCMGGSDAEKHHAECFLLTLNHGQLETREYPPLPVPLANMAGGKSGNVVYLTGGTQSAIATTASRETYALDLEAVSAGWKKLAPLPGVGRVLPVAAAFDGAFFIISGAALAAGTDGKPVRTYLKDAWLYQPGNGWSAIADIPQPAVAAPSPALWMDGHRLLVLGGDDGSHAGLSPNMPHPGFSRNVMAYNHTSHAWEMLAEIPHEVSPSVTAPVVRWGESYVIASGEVRPGIRSPQMLTLTLKP